jgi:hypothetical protein
LRADPARISELLALTKDQDWLVVMRATDLLEKLAHERPEWVDPYKEIFLSELADSDKWEIRPADRARTAYIRLAGQGQATGG